MDLFTTSFSHLQQEEGKGKEKQEEEGAMEIIEPKDTQPLLLPGGTTSSLNSSAGDYGAVETQVDVVEHREPRRTELDWLSCWKIIKLEPYDLLFFAALGVCFGATLSLLVFNEPTYFDVKEIGAMVVLSMSALTLLGLALSGRGSSSSLPHFSNATKPDLWFWRWATVAVLVALFTLTICTLLFVPRTCQGCALGKWLMVFYTCLTGVIPPLVMLSFVSPRKCGTMCTALAIVALLRIAVAMCIAMAMDDKDENAEVFLGIMDIINGPFGLVSLAIVLFYAPTLAGVIADEDSRLRFRMSVMGIIIRFFWLLAMLLIVNLAWAFELAYEQLIDLWPEAFEQAKVHRGGRSPPVELYAPWINAAWVWLIDFFPALLIALPMFCRFECAKRMGAVLKCFNAFALAFLYSAYVVDLIAAAAEDAISTRGFWMAKIGAKYLIGLVLYQWYIGFRTMRTVAMRFGLSEFLLLPELMPAHTHIVPFLLAILIGTHIVGWITMLAHTWFGMSIFAICTGTAATLAWLVVLLSYCVPTFGRWIGNHFSSWRAFHHWMIGISMLVLLVHGVLGFSGEPFFWVAFLFTAFLYAVEFFFCSFRRATLDRVFTPPTADEQFCLLKLRVSRQTGRFAHKGAYHPGQTILVRYKEKKIPKSGPIPTDAAVESKLESPAMRRCENCPRWSGSASYASWRRDYTDHRDAEAEAEAAVRAPSSEASNPSSTAWSLQQRTKDLRDQRKSVDHALDLGYHVLALNLLHQREEPELQRAAAQLIVVMLQDTRGGCMVAEKLIKNSNAPLAGGINEALNAECELTRAHVTTILAELARHAGGADLTQDAVVKSMSTFLHEQGARLELQEAVIQLVSVQFHSVEKEAEGQFAEATKCLAKLLSSPDTSLRVRKIAAALLKRIAEKVNVAEAAIDALVKALKEPDLVALSVDALFHLARFSTGASRALSAGAVGALLRTMKTAQKLREELQTLIGLLDGDNPELANALLLFLYAVASLPQVSAAVASEKLASAITSVVRQRPELDALAESVTDRMTNFESRKTINELEGFIGASKQTSSSSLSSTPSRSGSGSATRAPSSWRTDLCAALSPAPSLYRTTAKSLDDMNWKLTVAVREYSVMRVEEVDDGQVLSVVVKAATASTGAKPGNTSWLRRAHQYDFEVTGGFWSVFYQATLDPEPICVLGSGSGIGALLGVAVQRLQGRLPACAVFTLTEHGGGGEGARLSTALREALDGQGLEMVSETVIINGRKCWEYRYEHDPTGVLYLSQAGQATNPEGYFKAYIKANKGTKKLYLCGPNDPDALANDLGVEVIQEFNPGASQPQRPTKRK